MLRLRTTLASRRGTLLRTAATRTFASHTGGPVDRRCARTEKFDKKATLVFADGSRFEVRDDTLSHSPPGLRRCLAPLLSFSPLFRFVTLQPMGMLASTICFLRH